MSEDVRSYITDYEVRYKNGNTDFIGSDLVDRVINLKLTAGNPSKDSSGIITPSDTFVIRSDYEVFDANYYRRAISGEDVSPELYIRKCLYKPSIKVQYRQVAQGTAIAIDIFISNFFIFTKDGKAMMQFNNSSYPLRSVEVQMGYFGQFAQPYLYEKAGYKVPTNKQFFEMKAPPTVQVLKCTVDYVQTDKLPPDSTLHIHGWVANSYGTPIDSSKATVINFKPPVIASGNALKNLPHWFYNFVTRRFLRNNVLPENIKLIVDSAGHMKGADADLYGIRVYVSQGIKDIEEKLKVPDPDNDEKEVPFYWCAPACDTAFGTIASAKSLIGSEYRFKMLLNGNYLMYTKSELMKEAEDVDTLKNLDWYFFNYKTQSLDKYKLESILKESGSAEQTDVWITSEMQEKNMLPAVYNITTDALCTIVCPYFFYVNPFEVVKFRSRYALGGLVSYFANYNASDEEFTIISQDISFATVEDINECSMVAVGKKK